LKAGVAEHFPHHDIMVSDLPEPWVCQMIRSARGVAPSAARHAASQQPELLVASHDVDSARPVGIRENRKACRMM